MDCCNYMQYRSSYGFGPGYYDHLPDYNHGGDYYGQHIYHDYYNTQYYPQWSQVSHFPDYVYNPKEARIRKAMREATRDRSIGASPMLPRPGERTPSHSDWPQPQEDSIMMNPMSGIRRMDAPLCNYSMSHSENNHYLPPMNGYNKMEPSPLMSNYLQPSPLAQLQQQTEMWHPYKENMRPRSIGTPFHHPMMQEVQSTNYQTQEPVQEMATNLIMEKPRKSPGCSSLRGTPPSQVSDNSSLATSVVMDNLENHRPEAQSNQPHFVESKPSVETVQPTMMDGCRQHEDRYTPITDHTIGCSTFESPVKIEPVTVTKKPRGRPPSKKPQPQPPPPKPLPDFNEAFGSTERGRFLSPPDPRLNKSYLDMLFDNESTFTKFGDFQI